MDENDFDEFCRAMSPRLVGSLVLQCGDRNHAEDLAQEALARAWSNWSDVRAMSSPEGWVFRVAFNLATSRRRRRASESRANAKTRGEVATSLIDVADRVTLERLLASLPGRQRSVIALRYYVGFSVRETATVMGCAEGTVKSLTSHAIVRLKESIDIDLSVVSTGGDGNESLFG